MSTDRDLVHTTEAPRLSVERSPVNVAGRINAVAFASDTRTMAIAVDGQVIIGNIESHLDTCRLPGPRDQITALGFSPDGRTLTTAM
jgi:WD40 repeat protein